ncbi:MAG: hypothetical protein HC819_14130 [Cyclobacteriaceae bacterium]|nr:hypothetical protein [Cyclobacteriaceae bacterium]
MRKTIETVNFTKTEKLTRDIEKLFDKIGAFHERILALDVYLKLNSDGPVPDRHVGVRVFLPNQEIYVDVRGEDNFRGLAFQVYQKIRRSLSNLKEYIDPVTEGLPAV